MKTLGGATAAMAALPALASGQATGSAPQGRRQVHGRLRRAEDPEGAHRHDRRGRPRHRPRVAAGLDRGHRDRRDQRPLRGPARSASEQRVAAKGHKPKLYFGDQNLCRTMLTEAKPDMVVVATPWEDARADGRGGHEGRRPRVHRDAHRRHDGRDVAAGRTRPRRPAATACTWRTCATGARSCSTSTWSGRASSARSSTARRPTSTTCATR
ncbi:MAG: hypothetical protein MZW92_40435 [Comamonadaceae bacterium]|nr:hypothetical protein [Comamonadaceae bacterium]